MTGETDLPHAEWYAALTLAERIAAWKRRGSPVPTPGFDPGVAEWRMEEWRRQRPFDDDALFAARVASAGIGAEAFRALLGTPAPTLRDWCGGEAPAWLVSLRRILAAPPAELPAVALPAGPRGMLEVFAPFVADAQARLAAETAEIAAGDDDPPFAPESVHLLFLGGFLGRVLTTVSRVLTLELHVARMQGTLEGESAEERFRSFVARLRRPEHLAALLREYPVLARTLVRHADQWVETAAELLRRLRDDRERLRRELNGGAPLGRLATVRGSGVGDLHRGGRSVAILDFSSGARVVYKPRPLAVDLAFHRLLAWVNREGGCPPLRVLATLDRGAYGWVEFARAEPCAGPPEVERYYERLGGLLAVLYAIDGQDMHMENLVAAGEHPVLVDLETLFHPLHDDLLLRPRPAGAAAPDPLRPEPDAFIARSVLKMGLLPQRVWGDDESAGVDLSAVGGAGSQVATTRALRLENAGSDEMRFTRGEARVEGGPNQPHAEGSGFSPADYADALDRGFAGVYRTLAARRDALEAEGVLAAFAGLPLRVIVRPTRTYGALLGEGLHPDFLRDAVEMDRFLDRLWLGAAARPGLAALVPAEREALRRGDVPMFFAAPASRDLVSDTGAVTPGLFAAGGMERVRERIAGLSAGDLKRQRRLVRGALATLAGDALVPPVPPPPGVRLPAGPREDATDPDERVRLAEGVAKRLERLAVRGPRTAGWIGLTTRDGLHPVSGITGHDLHGGLPGILLFLARLGEGAGTGRHDALARDAFAGLGEALRELDAVHDVGAFSGTGGLLPVLAAVAERWPELPAPALAGRVVARTAALVGERRRCDLFGGVAGAAAGLLAHHRATGSAAALEAALRCGDRLLALAEPAGGSAAWPVPPAAGPHGAGFAFGAAGTAWALLHLAGATGETRFRDPALDALERAWRLWEGAPRSPATDGGWAHGAPGLALALAAGREADAAFAAPLERAVEAALHGLPDASHALCNGALGALDALSEVAGLLPGAGIAPRVEAEARVLLASARRHGWRCGAPLGVVPPGLMNGLAGIGYGLLRLARPGRVPSILTLGLGATSAAPGSAAALPEPALNVR